MTLHRIAVVGCGLFSENRLLPALVANPRVNLAAVCDQDPLRAETLLECARLFRRYRPSMPGHGDTVSEERLSEKQEKKYRETDG